MRLDHAAADREAETGARDLRSPARDAVEHVENRSRASGGMPGPLSLTRKINRCPSRAPATAIRPPAGEYLMALSRMLTSTCSISTGSTWSSGKSCGMSNVDLDDVKRLRQLLHRPADNLAQIEPFAPRLQRAIAEPGHVEQVLDEAVEPLALVEDGGQQLRAVRAGSGRSQLASVVAEPIIDTSGVRRSCDTDESSAERSCSVSVSSRASSMSAARLVRSTATAT